MSQRVSRYQASQPFAGLNKPYRPDFSNHSVAQGERAFHDQTNTQRVTGSYSIKNSKLVPPASGLKYKVGTDVNILTYRTRINVGANAPTITTDNPIRNLDVTWNGMTVWWNSSVTITTDFIVPTWNAISYSNVRFTYPGGFIQEEEGDLLPAFRWNVQTAVVGTHM